MALKGEVMTDEEIIEKAESLARLFHEFDGFTVPSDFVFHRSENPRAKETWARVVLAFEELLQTPLRDVVEEMEK
jgi:hypothetical protein